MSLFPEQQRALDYVRRRGTEAPVDAIRSRVAATYSEIEAMAGGVPAEGAQRRPAPSSWSVYEVVDHLIESDRPAIRQLAELLAGRSVDAHIPAGLQSRQPFSTDWPSLLARFREVHRQILALLDSAMDDIPLAGTAPVEMVVKCAAPNGALQPVHWIERFDWKAYALLLHAHNREHIGQLQRILSRVALKPERKGGLRGTGNVELEAGSSEETPLELRLVPDTGTLHYRWGTAPPSLVRKGAPVPDFEVKKLAGGKETLSNLRGKVVVINSWAVWCAPCVEEIPALNRLVEKYGAREDVVFLAISPDTTRDLKAFFKRRPFLYEHALANRDTQRLFKQTYPRHVIVDREGKVVYDRTGGFKTVDKALDKVLVGLLGPG